jgi:hypothetical protein
MKVCPADGTCLDANPNVPRLRYGIGAFFKH